jgi:hypothetical protein
MLIPALAVGVLAAAGAQANDRWEASTSSCANDDTVTTSGGGSCNQLIHGQRQVHDVQSTSPARDEDWMVVETKLRHSYEAKIFSSSTVLSISSTFPAGNSLLMNRVNAAGTTLTSSIAPDGTLQYGDTGGWLAVRWIGAANQRDWIRVQGKNFDNPSFNDQYEIEFADTTYFLPRFNNANGQVTVLLIQNTTSAAVTGSIFFYSTAGALLHTEPLNIPVFGMQTVNTAAIGPLAGLSGHATIAHNGGYGALAGKSVALESATGFSFDTPAVPIPK